MKARKLRQPPSPKRAIEVLPREFVFVDRRTGKRLFAVKPGSDGSLPLEETSSLLAMHCLLRSQTPADFGVMVTVERSFMDRVVPRTKKLMEACSSELTPIQVTVRQQQVLRGIFQNQRNKEIAAGMNVAERTVKFHVAALLEKFHVRTRIELTEKVGHLISSGGPGGSPLPREFPGRALRAPAPGSKRPLPTLVRAAGDRRATQKLPA